MKCDNKGVRLCVKISEEVKRGAEGPSGSCPGSSEMLAQLRGVSAKPRFSLTILVSVVVAVIFNAESATGGICWSSIRKGRCTELLAQGISRQDCCASNTAAATAYSEEDLDSGALFFWRVLGGGVPCRSCRESCNEVRCEEGKKCVVRRGRPRCVCNPECKSPRGGGGPVCGTDGRSYRTICRLKKRACKKGSQDLAVAYNGHCQSSCTGVRCGQGRSCLLDQNLSPHCVKCARRCPPGTVTGTGAVAQIRQGLPGLQEAIQNAGINRPVCGSDGNTYKSACHLRLAACRAGRAIPVAYKGRCKQAADCSSIRCREGQTCLTEIGSGRPRCVTCSYRCPRKRERNQSSSSVSGTGTNNAPQYCASNNITYPSWCHIIKDACVTGFVLETLHPGPCNANDAAVYVDGNSTSLATYDVDLADEVARTDDSSSELRRDPRLL